MSKLRAVSLLALSCMLVNWNPAIFAQSGRADAPDASETSRDNPAARDQWFVRGRVAPKGKTPAEMRWQAYQQKIQMRAARMVAARQAKAAVNSAAASTGWTALGPAPLVSDPGTGQDYSFVSGRATSVVIDPADATGNTAYLGGAYGGLWRTTNGLDGGFGSPGGVTWTPLIDAMSTLAVGAIAIQPGNATVTPPFLSNVILVGTGEANSSADSYYGLGMLRSADHGQNWTLITQDTLGHPFHGLAFSKIAFSTANTSTVVAATATSTLGVLDGSRDGTELRGVYLSTNAGQSWTFESSVKDGANSISPLTNSVTSVVFNASAGKFYAAFRYHGFYSSTDGANWTRLGTQPGALNSLATCPTTIPNSTNPPTCPIYRGEITVVPTRNEMYVWFTDSGDNDQGIWKTTNGGNTWAQINDSNITSCGDAFGGCGTAQGGYDLELAAVANGTNTDLYAGARNLYKCTITTSSPTCSGTTEPNFFMNLTHVYGCSPIGSIAKFHPDQHALDAVIAGGKAVMYFANDGGVYRAVDGFAGLHTGVCGNTNQFDSLNGTLGSMTEFVSMSQDATDPNIVLGGTQDNGSPASGSARTNSQWHSVLGGDGGYNEINPNTTGASGQWFTSNPPFTTNSGTFNINIYGCSLGTGCSDPGFGNTTKNSDIGGDIAPFYPFFMLDPQTPAKMIIGTSCRLWRGDVSSGVASGFVALTDSFETPGAVPCTGKEVNQVHAADAGGATDANGSKVVYAVTEGTGPNAQAPTGGEVWATITATGGAGTWSNVTSTINPNHYSIGAVTVDPSDATGSTAYVGIQGFQGGLHGQTSHIFKTTNHGGTWTDFSGSLATAIPDAPVNSLVVDTTAGVLYVGTDAGVFNSPTNSATWAEVGPSPSIGTAGYLPNAPVTKLRIYSKSGTRILRASTYGRGIWEFQLATGTPDFTVSVPTTLTAYPNQTLPYNGTLMAVNAYVSPVGLTCTGGVPTTCAAATTPVTPTTGGAAFAINAANATVADFSFAIHALGTDSVPVVHDTPVTLHVVDFAITAPNPGTVTANIPNVSNPTTFTVSASGSFADILTLGCIGVPPGAICNFSPSATVQPTSSTPVLVTLTIGASTTTTPGSYPLTISAHDATNPEPVAKVQALTLNVTANPDYTLAIGNPTPPAITKQGQQPFNGTLTAFQGYNKPVTITCAAGATAPPATCLVTTSLTTPTVGGASFTVLTADTVIGTFNFIVHTTDGTITHDLPVTLVLQEDFNIINTTTSQTVTAGGTASYTPPLSFNPDGAATFLNAVSYTCTGLPSLSSCTFSPASIPAGSGSTPVTLSIHTTAPVASGAPLGLPWKPSGPLFAFWLSLPALGIVSMGAHRRARKRLAILGGLLALGLVGSFAACGGGSSHQPQPGTPPGPYTVTIKAVSGIATQSTTVKLVVQ